MENLDKVIKKEPNPEKSNEKQQSNLIPKFGAISSTLTRESGRYFLKNIIE